MFSRAMTMLALLLLANVAHAAEPPAGLTADELAAIQRDIATIEKESLGNPDMVVFAKAVTWALRYETKLTPADVALIKKALEQGKQRVADKDRKWRKKKGSLILAYGSMLDHSVQPFGVIVPAKYDPKKPIRLDIVLHGSTRPVGMSELRFMSRFEDTGKEPPDVDYIEVHPLGRVENGYRWAGEFDVIETLLTAKGDYNIDLDRVVLRGMSMGASGTWHVGLKYPDFFAALGPYCGYVDTVNFSKTPIKDFVKVENLPEHQVKMLHMLDSIDYAANARTVPVVAAMGEKDPFFEAHVLMEKAMEKEGLKLVNYISPGTGHVIDPTAHKIQMRRIAQHVAKGRDAQPSKVHHVTWTLRYPRCHWLLLDGLEEHYVRAEAVAEQNDDGAIEFKVLKNVTAFSINRSGLPKPMASLKIDGERVKLPDDINNRRDPYVTVQRRGKRWELTNKSQLWMTKCGFHQGPIDDAFASRSFLCIRGTGKPLNPAVHAWSEANLKRFAYEWNRYFRGDLPLKDDKDVTDDDLLGRNLILFGDPGSNSFIAKALPKLPIQWTKDEIRLGDARYAADKHVPAMIYPNVLTFPGLYLVINSGHTFHEKELASLNYLLYPRLGDWAIFKVGDKMPEKPSDPLDETVIKTGFFDENWKVKEK